MHTQFSCSLGEQPVDKEQTSRWLKFGDIKGKTQNKTVAAQDQALSTKCFKEKVMKEEIERKWRLFKHTKKVLNT
jgi:hypothetical protein